MSNESDPPKSALEQVFDECQKEARAEVKNARGPRDVEGVFKMPLDVNHISTSTITSRHRAERLDKALAHYKIDSSKEVRRKVFKCKSCYYFDFGVAGQAFSEKPCKNMECDKYSRWPNTAVPAYCEECAKEYGICRSCGGDLEQIDRRSLKPPKRRA